MYQREDILSDKKVQLMRLFLSVNILVTIAKSFSKTRLNESEIKFSTEVNKLLRQGDINTISICLIKANSMWSSMFEGSGLIAY